MWLACSGNAALSYAPLIMRLLLVSAGVNAPANLPVSRVEVRHLTARAHDSIQLKQHV